MGKPDDEYTKTEPPAKTEPSPETTVPTPAPALPTAVQEFYSGETPASMPPAVRERLIQAISFQPIDALVILQRLRAAFPVTPGAGTHCISLNDHNQLEIHVCDENRVYTVVYKTVDMRDWTPDHFSEVERRIMQAEESYRKDLEPGVAVEAIPGFRLGAPDSD